MKKMFHASMLLHALQHSAGRFVCAIALACAVLLTGTACGYRLGSIMHPQIKTVAIAEVKNETGEALAAALLRNLLAERFQFDNSLKLVSPARADCIVYARILKVENVGVIWRSHDNEQTYRPSEFRITAEVEFTVLIPGQAKPLVPRTTTAGYAIYLYTADPAIGRENGLRQAFLKIADNIVHAATEAW